MKRAGRVWFRGGRALRARPLVACVCGPLRGPGRFGSALRLRAARPRLWFVRASRRRPVFRAPSLHKEAEASRGLVVRGPGAAAVLRAPASPCARPRRVLGRVVRGGPRRFFPEALASGKGRASGRFVSSWPLSRPLLFSARETALGFAAPGSFGESRARQSAVQSAESGGKRERNQLRERVARPWRGQSAWLWRGQRERSLALTQRIPASPATVAQLDA